MSDMTVEVFEAALARHASADGEVFPSALGLIEAEHAREGRLWAVAKVVMADQERMRYLAGGNRLAEVVSCVSQWYESDLDVADVELVVSAGGYDPEPFEALRRAGLLHQALSEGDRPRVIDGERAGAWISDQMAETNDAETVSRMTAKLEAPAGAPAAAAGAGAAPGTGGRS
ncbi:MAG: hypothetical protein KGQ66_00095 [Acidobacteriota bacterium]|nr:hypothetical protein [Acidobacteriota bacterium]